MNIQQMMKQAKQMQKDLEKKQDEISNAEFTAENEGVILIIKGDYTLQKVEIKKVLDSEFLEDMITLAYNDIINQIKKETESKLGQVANIPGIF